MPYKDPTQQRQYQADWHAAHRAPRTEYKRISREQLRERIRQIKATTPCADCKKQWPYYVMDFDHRDGCEKVSDVSRMAVKYGAAKVMEEIAKCDVVCASCHRVRTHERMVRAKVPLPGSTPAD